MSRVKREYGKAVVMALFAALLLVLEVVERSFDGAGLTIVFGALCANFLIRARAFTRIAARRGCGQTPQP